MFYAKTKNGNIGVSKFSQEIADFQALRMDQDGCFNCENCYGCQNCVGCKNCLDCINCSDCVNLVNGNNSMSSQIEILEPLLIKVITSYLVNPVAPSYKTPDALRKIGVIPERLLLMRCLNLGAFRASGDSGSILIKQTIQSLIKKGYLQPVDMASGPNSTRFKGSCYKVASFNTKRL